jgi:hypothetical protein
MNREVPGRVEALAFSFAEVATTEAERLLVGIPAEQNEAGELVATTLLAVREEDRITTGHCITRTGTSTGVFYEYAKEHPEGYFTRAVWHAGDGEMRTFAQSPKLTVESSNLPEDRTTTIVNLGNAIPFDPENQKVITRRLGRDAVVPRNFLRRVLLAVGR